MTVSDHNHAASLLHHVRCAKEALRRGDLASVDHYLSVSRSLAWSLPKVRSKAKIVAGIAHMQSQADRRYVAVQIAAAAYEPSGMDLMKDYGEGGFTRRPGQ